jgi:hypothetical protein
VELSVIAVVVGEVATPISRFGCKVGARTISTSAILARRPSTPRPSSTSREASGEDSGETAAHFGWVSWTFDTVVFFVWCECRFATTCFGESYLQPDGQTLLP